jgi:hypothetical protein
MWKLAGGANEDPADPRSLLEPTFYIEEAVGDTIVEQVGQWVDERPNWICPGLNRRCNQRYLSRLRRRHKGVLWTIYDTQDAVL